MPNHHGRKRPILSDAEQAELEAWVQSPSTSQALASRAQFILETANGCGDAFVAEKQGISRVAEDLAPAILGPARR